MNHDVTFTPEIGHQIKRWKPKRGHQVLLEADQLLMIVGMVKIQTFFCGGFLA